MKSQIKNNISIFFVPTKLKLIIWFILTAIFFGSIFGIAPFAQIKKVGDTIIAVPSVGIYLSIYPIAPLLKLSEYRFVTKIFIVLIYYYIISCIIGCGYKTLKKLKK